MTNTLKSLGGLLALLLLVGLSGCGKSDAANSTEGDSKDKPAAATASIPGPAAPPAADPKRPVVLIETNLGPITVRLNADKAPLTVDNFLSYVDSGFYNQTIIHQVFKGQGVLAGGYGVDMTEKPTRSPIHNEATNGLKNRRGTIAMARTADAANSGRSQFLFNVADNEALDHRERTPEGYGYCVFGEVTAGLDVLDKIANAAVQDTPQMDSTPTQPIVIKSIRRSK